VVSEGVIVEACNQVAEQAKPVNQACKEELQATTGPSHFDETGECIEKKLWWLLVTCTRVLTYYGVHRHRSSKALDTIGIFPVFKGATAHDR
jgi:transposase